MVQGASSLGVVHVEHTWLREVVIVVVDVVVSAPDGDPSYPAFVAVEAVELVMVVVSACDVVGLVPPFSWVCL